MTNVVALKSVKYIEWTVKTTGTFSTYVSKSFSMQGHEFYLEFSFCGDYSYLNFRTSEILLSQVNVTVRVSNTSRTVHVQAHTITRTSTSFHFNSNNGNGFLNTLLTFQIMIHADLPKDDTLVPSYKDASFSMESISRDFSKLLDEGPNHDMEFTCGNKTIRAHKNIVCSRSNVFSSMLQSDMIEGKTGRVDIQDMDAAIFKQFLRCLYTGMLPELTVDFAFQLYEAADRYGVDAMKKQCADYLTDNLSPENACDILVLSYGHSDKDFNKKVLEFAIRNKIPYIGQKWTEFCEDYPMLAVEVYSLFCEQFRPK